MKVPHCRIRTVGEFSDWGRRFLESIQSAQLAELSPVPSVQDLVGEKSAALSIVLLENTKDSHGIIEKLRQSQNRHFILWVGRIFSKEDFQFALEHRVFWVFENPHLEGEQVEKGLTRVAHHMERDKSVDLIVRSIKSIILQAEGDIAPAVMTELKTAISKLSDVAAEDIFATGNAVHGKTGDEHLLIGKTESLRDVLTTIDNLERTGVLWVRGNLPGEEGRIETLQGKITGAFVGDVRGEKAVYRMFLWSDPKFMFTRRDSDEVDMNQNFHATIRSLGAEGEEHLRRFEKIRKELPPPQIKLELDPHFLHSGVEMTEEEFHTLASVVEFGKVAQVLDYNALPDAVLYEALISLRKKNVIRIAA